MYQLRVRGQVVSTHPTRSEAEYINTGWENRMITIKQGLRPLSHRSTAMQHGQQIGFAVYQSGGAIFGIGRNPAEAWAEAQQWLDATTPQRYQMVDGTSGDVEGQLYMRHCDAALLASVATEGGAVLYHVGPTGALHLCQLTGGRENLSSPY